MFTPSRSCPALFIYDPMTRQLLSSWRISKRPTHHPGMARPPRQGRDITVRGHLAARNLTDNTQHVSLKRPHLIHRHFIWIILHLFQNDTKGDGSVLYFRSESTKAFFILLRKSAPYSRLAPSGRVLRTIRLNSIKTVQNRTVPFCTKVCPARLGRNL